MAHPFGGQTQPTANRQAPSTERPFDLGASRELDALENEGAALCAAARLLRGPALRSKRVYAILLSLSLAWAETDIRRRELEEQVGV